MVWPGAGAQFRSMHRISLRHGARTVRLLHAMEAVYYVLDGSSVVVDLTNPSNQELVCGSMIHVELGTPYLFASCVVR